MNWDGGRGADVPTGHGKGEFGNHFHKPFHFLESFWGLTSHISTNLPTTDHLLMAPELLYSRKAVLQ
jgi:hypothetical protein